MQHPRRGVLIGVREHDEELFATPPCHDVGFSQAGGDGARHLGQHLISGPVPELVVDALEVIDVDHGHAEAPTRAHAAVLFGVQQLQHAPAVDEPGQFVVRRQLADAVQGF